MLSELLRWTVHSAEVLAVELDNYDARGELMNGTGQDAVRSLEAYYKGESANSYPQQLRDIKGELLLHDNSIEYLAAEFAWARAVQR